MTQPAARWCSSCFNRGRPILVAFLLLLPVAAAAQTGTVTGQVRAARSLEPIADVTVFVYGTELDLSHSDVTDAGGFFSVSGLPPGNYFALARPSRFGPFLPEVFPGSPCPLRCLQEVELLAGTPFAVTAGGTTSNRNFTLGLGGSVSGRVTNAATGAPLENVRVFLAARLGTTVRPFTSENTDASGNYTFTPLSSGSYIAFTENDIGFVDEIFGNIPCSGSCFQAPLHRGTAIDVTGAATTSGRDFALDAGGRITGVVTNAATGTPLPNVQVNIDATDSFNHVASAQTDATGTYTVGGLLAGTYYASTINGQEFVNEIYDDVLCPVECLPTTAMQSGRPIAVALGATTSGRNFALSRGGSISGRIINETTEAPLANIQVNAFVRVGTQVFGRSTLTNAAGNYTIAGLPTGAYRLATSNNQGFVNEIYDNRQCGGNCSDTAMAIGSPVSAIAGATTAGIDFALQPGGSITGTIVDSTTGLPIRSMLVEAYAMVGGLLRRVGGGVTDASGAYAITGLQTGTHVVATSGSRPWRNEAYDNLACIGSTCSDDILAASTPVPVTAGAASPGRDFALARGDIVQGQMTDAATGSPLAFANVTLVHSPSGTTAALATTGPNGVYSFRGVPNGSYVAFTSNANGYVNEIYDNLQCATTCDVSTALAAGTPITVTAAAADGRAGDSLVLSRNFALAERNQPPAAPTGFRATVAGGVAQFSWTEPSTSVAGPAASYVIEAGVSPGTTIVTIPVAGTAHTVNGVPPGVFFVRVRAVNAFGSGPPSTEVALTVGSGATALPETPTAVTAFMSGDRLTLTWAAAVNGGPSSSFVVEAGSATGAANIATLPVSARSLTFVPVPNGFYFLRVRAVNAAGTSPPSAEVMIVVGNIASPPGAPDFSNHSVSGSTVTLDWQAPSVGTVTSYIVEAGSAPGLANLAVVNTGNASVTASFTNVPPGTYFVRVRAANALGIGVVSNERTIVVP